MLLPDFVELTIMIGGLLGVIFLILAVASKQSSRRRIFALVCFAAVFSILIAFLISLILGSEVILVYWLG